MKYIKHVESWKRIYFQDVKTNYEISDLGNVRNSKTGRILRQFIQNNGYYGFTISVNNQPHSFKTASMVAKYFIPKPNDGLYYEVNHIDPEHKDDNSVYNLEWVTPEENKAHAVRHDLYHHRCGEINPMSKYTNEQIRNLCILMEQNNLPLDELVGTTGVQRETIADIYWGCRWKSISCEDNVRNYDKLPINSNKKNSIETITKACEMIEDGCRNIDISAALGIGKDTVKRLKAGKIFKSIVCNYEFYKSKHKS